MKAHGEKITALTAYDYPTARLLDESGIDIILVGDSLGMVVLGYPDTTQVTLAEMIHHTRAAARGVKRATLVADLPIKTYDNAEQAVATARELVAAGAPAVKLEGGASHAKRIEAVVQAGIPVMAHIGMLPQSVREEGGYRIKGRSQSELEQLIQDAHAVEKAGAFAVVLEIVAPDAARQVTEAIGSYHRHRVRRPLRWPDPRYSRSHRPVSVVYAGLVYRSQRGGRNTACCHGLY